MSHKSVASVVRDEGGKNVLSVSLRTHDRTIPETVLSVIVPVFDEEQTIESVLESLQRDLLPYGGIEVIVVNDGSTDRTHWILDQVASDSIRCVHMERNCGKTAAVRKGLQLARGKWVIVQDADSEYSPGEIAALLDIGERKNGVVYGRRSSYWHKPSRWPFAVGVLTIDLWLCALHRTWVRDHATCYKLVQRDILEKMELESTGFEGCVEITSKLMRMRIPITQVPIHYVPRPVSAGKKLKPTYFFTAIASAWRWRHWCVAKPRGEK